MRIALVSTYTHPVALGLRYVSSYLKAAGHDVDVLFMTSRRATTAADFPKAAMEAFLERCRGTDLIGMSLMTNTFHRACALTGAIRAAGIRAPIIWGGTHPTVAPDESLEVADIVCIGEGEEPVRQLADRLAAGGDPTRIQSLAFRAGGPFGNRGVVRNEIHPLEADLDKLPFPDYGLANHWVVDKGELAAARPENLRGTLHRLRVLTTRGCPHRCTFCNNTAMMNVHKGKGPWVRKRSNENVIAELEQAKGRLPMLEEVNIVDDLFFIRSEEEMVDFVEKYARRVNVPLQLDAHPNTITEGKVRILSRLPINLISMGIQSGSPDTLANIYQRHTPLERIIQAMVIFARHRIRTEYHYIVNNPYEADASVIETMRFIASHHRRAAVLRVFPLMFYPGTPLYERARADGRIGPRHEVAYNVMYDSRLKLAGHDYLATWLRAVLGLRNAGAPRWLAHGLISVVTSRPVRFCLDRRWFSAVSFYTYHVAHKLYNTLIYQPFIRPIRHFRRKPRDARLHPREEATPPSDKMAADARPDRTDAAA